MRKFVIGGDWACVNVCHFFTLNGLKNFDEILVLDNL